MGLAKDYYLESNKEQLDRLIFDYKYMTASDFSDAYNFTKQSIRKYLVELPQKYSELLTTESSASLLQMSVTPTTAMELNQTLNELSKKLGVNRYLFEDAIIKEGIDSLREKYL